MTIGQWLDESTAILQQAGIGTARLDALVLLERACQVNRAKLLAGPETTLSKAKHAELNNLLKRRITHEPMAYILGTAEFYGRSFLIKPGVLQPRPESETMIDELKNLTDLPNNVYIADIGTGSGALGITTKIELPEARVDLIDIDLNALKIAKSNVDKFTLDISVLQADLLANLEHDYDVLLCNLPYVPDDFQINTAASHEPKLAIFGGPDGLDVYRKLFNQLTTMNNHPLYFLLESLPTQHDELRKLASEAGYKMVKENDFIQVFKRIQK